MLERDFQVTWLHSKYQINFFFFLKCKNTGQVTPLRKKDGKLPYRLLKTKDVYDLERGGSWNRNRLKTYSINLKMTEINFKINKHHLLLMEK